ncbi:DUF4296 domain-containing protein [Kordia sp.]|uniref:DUF4296 domain-containing protein n=1 Tax=Kordia sp. TaxID=1965332 RepID=UPI003D2C989A
MKRYIWCLLVVLGMVSCRKEAVPKPDNLLSNQEMANILYDITLINAMKGVDKKGVEASFIQYDTYLYKKYNIDSAQFARSNNYYAADPLRYDKIYALVDARLKEERAEVEATMKKEQVRRDSLQKAKKEEQARLKKLNDTIPKAKYDLKEKVG